MRKLPKILHIEPLASTRLFRIEAVDLEFSNGEQRTFECLATKGKQAVMVVPILNDESLLLIREYCVGSQAYELGFPKGIVDPHEALSEAANRELKEEIGYGAREWVELRNLQTAPGILSLPLNIFLARGLYPERLAGDEPEELEVVSWPLQHIDDLLHHPDLRESRSLAALYLARDWLQENRKG